MINGVYSELTKEFNNDGILLSGGELQKLDLTINKGVTALIDPNGAGKSTLLKILAAIIRPTDGEALFCVKNQNKLFHFS